LLPPLRLFPHREGRRAVPHGTGSSTHKKTPTWNGRGRHTHAAAPFPRKDVSALGRTGLLARGMSLLSAPSQGQAPQWSLQISFRSQLRGSDGFAPSSLVTVSDCDQPYQRHMQFCRGAYGSTLGFVKDVSEESGEQRHNPQSGCPSGSRKQTSWTAETVCGPLPQTCSTSLTRVSPVLSVYSSMKLPWKRRSIMQIPGDTRIIACLFKVLHAKKGRFNSLRIMRVIR
jgi:hypothetical protein